MGAEHHGFIRFVGSGDLADDVERVEIGIVELVCDVHLQRNRHFLIERPCDATVVLHSDHDLRRHGWILGVAGAARADEERAAVAAAGIDEREHAFVEEKLHPLTLELLLPLKCPASAPAACGRLPGEVRKVRVAVAAARRREVRLYLPHRGRQDELSPQLAPPCVKILLALDVGEHRFARDRAVGAGRPGFGEADERIGARRHRHRDEAFGLPSAAERPRLDVNVGEAPVFHRLHRPVGGFLDVGRAGQARAIYVGEVALNLHHLRALRLQPFFLDAVHGVEIDLLGDRPVGGDRQAQDDGEHRGERESTSGNHENDASSRTTVALGLPFFKAGPGGPCGR